MNRTYDILSAILLLLVGGGCFHSCQQDELGETIPDKETLIAQGRYLTARSVDAVAASEDPDRISWFEVGTPYRLLAFTNPYDASAPGDKKNTVNHPRFNKVAWEGTTSAGLRFINIDSDPDKWFGFSAIGEEQGGTDGLVSLDFYGFTYGKKVETHPSGYIELDNLPEEKIPGEGSLTSLKRSEKVSADKTALNDLLRGESLNQNMATAGKDASAATQSVLLFKHCFSKLHFLAVQQAEDKSDEKVNPVPCFANLQIEKIEVTRTYGEGAVYLQDGKVQLEGDTISRPLRFKDTFKGNVTLEQVDMGEMIVFPSDGAALKNEDKADGYSVGLNITVKSTNKTDIEQFLANTGSPVKIIPETSEDGETTYKGIIVKKSIIDNYTNKELHFKQNTAYTLVLSFQKDAVRIITVIPQVEEWLPGEGTEADPWQDQALGQPQMFDNIVWSDRNLGADHYDPLGEDFEKTIGYFYQSGRNIPYYPFKYKDYDNGKKPVFKDKNNQHMANCNTGWRQSGFRFYPIVDSAILRMSGSSDWTVYDINAPDSLGKKGNPQMYIPEVKPPEEYYFDFMRRIDEWTGGFKQDMHWEKGQRNQPVAGAWIVPSSKDFLTIFPSTPHAGNIVFNKVGNNTDPVNWGIAGTPDYQITGTDVLRVTVPYFKAGSTDADKPNATEKSQNYRNAWQTLLDNRDEGTSHIDKYGGDEYPTGIKVGAPGSPDNIKYEPDGDPEDGYASVYVISRAGEDEVKLSDAIKGKFTVKSWGTIYAIKRVYTPQAYRMRWRALIAKEGTQNPCIYIEICRYRCNADDHLNETNYKKDYDWEHPAARLYFPVCGLGDWTGEYINFGTECQYATSDTIRGDKTSALQIKITGNNASNAYIAVIKGNTRREFAKQIRPIAGGVTGSK